MLTKRQKQILDYIKEFIEENDYAPTIEETKNHFHLSSLATVHKHIENLRSKGYLRKIENQPRSIQLNNKKKLSDLIQIPLLGTIAAGAPIEAIQEKEFIAVPKSKLPKNGDIFALRIIGNSMIDENINDGDMVLVKQQSTAKNGQKVVALIDNHEATLKKFYREQGRIRLQPANNKIEPIIIDKGVPLSIQGIVIDIIKNRKLESKTKPIIKEENQKELLFKKNIKVAHRYNKNAEAILFHGDRLKLMKSIPDKSVKLMVTSPPYNIGKEYEKVKDLDIYLNEQKETIKEGVRILKDDGSICWQVGNHISKDREIFPLDALIYKIGKDLGLKLRNRIIWHFGHGLHCTKRFSGRHETILWFTKNDNYTFNLDPIRVPQKYPGKRNFKKNEKYGTLSCNPLGKNPSDIWEIPNVKHNHPEKTGHPCQFPIELIERLVLSMTNEKDIIFDPYMGVGSALCAAILHNRKGYGADIMKKYIKIAEKRIRATASGTLKRRPMGKPIYQPTNKTKAAEMPNEFLKIQNNLFGARA